MRAKECLRLTFSKFDHVAADVSLNYQKKSSHGTILGGICSIVAAIIVIFFVFSELYQLIDTPSWNQNVQKSFLVPTNADPYVVDVKNATLAVSLYDLHSEAEKTSNLSRIVQPIFFTASRTEDGSWSNKTYYEAVPCEDVFGDHVDNTWSLKQILQTNGPWLCPKDLQSYNILNRGNEAIYLSLESCKVANTHHGLGDPS